MACGACGGGKKIKIERTNVVAMNTGKNKQPIRPRKNLIRSIRPANNLDTRN